MKQVKTYGSLIAGRPYFKELDRFWMEVPFLNDGPIELIVQKVYNKRSNDQNGYYWGVVIDCYRRGFLDTWGEPCSIQEAHDSLKERYNFQEMVNPDTGEILKIIKDTRSLNTSEYSEYIENCRNFIHEWFGISVPDPIKPQEDET